MCCNPASALLLPCLCLIVAFQDFVGHAATTFYDKTGAALRKFEVPVKDPPTSLRIFRDEIGRLLINEAQRLHPGKISFRFSNPVVAVNLDDQTVRVANGSDHNDVKQVINQHHISRCVACMHQLLQLRLQASAKSVTYSASLYIAIWRHALTFYVTTTLTHCCCN